MIQTTLIKKVLKNFYHHEGVERVGFILPDNNIVEVQNIADKPTEGFMIAPADIIELVDNQGAVATWHTHPNQSSNLSGEDYRMFKSWPKLIHFVVGNDGVKAFQFDAASQEVLEIC